MSDAPSAISKSAEEAEALHGRNLQSAIDFVLRGDPPLPVVKIGKMSLPEGSADAVRCLEIAGILKDYAGRSDSCVKRPLSVAVFGPPGSGKSFCVKQVLEEAGCDEPHVINLSQLSHPGKLAESLETQIKVAAKKSAESQPACEVDPKEKSDASEKHKKTKPKVFFFDEFDTALNDESLGWLRWFLGPMQDGMFFHEGRPVELTKAIFMFAGGTAESLSEFEKRALEDPGEYSRKKVPDFISRLCGFIDIEGINGKYNELPMRRALVLRHQVHERWQDELEKPGSQFPIDEALARKLLSNVHFVHGVRSMEALLNMSRLENAKIQLPNDELKKLHLSRGILDGKIIGISSGQQDQGTEGFLMDLSEKLLNIGATLAYGGEFIPGGILSKVVEAASRVPDELIDRPDKRIRNYLAFPTFHRVPDPKPVEEEQRKREQYIDFIKLETLSKFELQELGVPNGEWFRARDDENPNAYNPNRHLVWAISLFRMRARMLQDIDALIVLGGKDDGKSWGRFSGIAEEVMLAFALGKPVYVLGGWGGGANAVGKLIGLDNIVANPNNCLAGEKDGTPLSSGTYADYFVMPGHPELPRTISEVRAFLFARAITTSGWTRNGLSLEENRTLFGPHDGRPSSVEALADLIIAGLRRIDWKLSGRPPLEDPHPAKSGGLKSS
jgi:SLOG cluster2/AAA domain